MTEDRLRLWALGALSGDERREVTRWVVQCTDPQLPVLLRGFVREAAEAEADRSLRGHGTAWARLVEGWHQLLDAASAGWADVDAGLVLASAPEEGPWAELVPGPAVRLSTSEEVAVYLVDDRPSVVRVYGSGPGPGPNAPIPLPTPARRPTAWVARGVRLPRDADVLTELLAALDTAEVQAFRWEPAE
ncbi:MAG: hypothetical protein ACI8PZ_007023 [Myxococcota bacterium]|jgi:hypothetical protein